MSRIAMGCGITRDPISPRARLSSLVRQLSGYAWWGGDALYDSERRLIRLDGPTYQAQPSLTELDFEAAGISGWTTSGCTLEKVAGARTGGSGARFGRVTVNDAVTSYIYLNAANLITGCQYVGNIWVKGLVGTAYLFFRVSDGNGGAGYAASAASEIPSVWTQYENNSESGYTNILIWCGANNAVIDLDDLHMQNVTTGSIPLTIGSGTLAQATLANMPYIVNTGSMTAPGVYTIKLNSTDNASFTPSGSIANWAVHLIVKPTSVASAQCLFGVNTSDAALSITSSGLIQFFDGTNTLSFGMKLPADANASQVSLFKTGTSYRLRVNGNLSDAVTGVDVALTKFTLGQRGSGGLNALAGEFRAFVVVPHHTPEDPDDIALVTLLGRVTQTKVITPNSDLLEIAEVLRGAIFDPTAVLNAPTPSIPTFTGTNWTNQGGGWYRHTTGNSTPAVGNALLITGCRYRVTFQISKLTAGCFTLVIGAGSYGTARTANGIYTEELVCGTNSNLYVVPQSDADGTFKILSIESLSTLNALVSAPQPALVDGDMEAAGTSDWLPENATLSKTTDNPYAGSRSLRVTRSGTGASYAHQQKHTVGCAYRVTVAMRGDGSGAYPQLYLGATLAFSGTTSTQWQTFSGIYTQAITASISPLTAASSIGSYADFDNLTSSNVSRTGAYWRGFGALSGLTSVQSTATAMPWETTDSSGRTVVKFDGSADYFTQNALAAIATAKGQYTLFSLLKISAFVSQGTITSWASTAAMYPYRNNIVVNSSQIAIRHALSAGDIRYSQYITCPTNAVHVLEETCDASTLSLSVDGATPGTVDVSGFDTFAFNIHSVGGFAFGGGAFGSPYPVDVYKIIAIPVALSATLRSRIRKMLGNYGGITVA